VTISLGCFLLLPSSISLIVALTAVVLIGIGVGIPYAAMFSRAAKLFPGRAAAAMGFVNMLGIIMILGGGSARGALGGLNGVFQDELRCPWRLLAGYLRGHTSTRPRRPCAAHLTVGKPGSIPRIYSAADAWAAVFPRAIFWAMKSNNLRSPSLARLRS